MNSPLNSLGIDKLPSETRVVVAMSGGVDSSTAAALMVEQGYEVIGVTLQLYDHGAAIAKKGSCCAGQDIHDARRVADKIGIPHYVLDYEDRFRESVIDDFADTYLRGETPIPCVRCNQTVKFRDLLKTAQDLGADVLVTGHYVQRVMGEDGPELHRGDDDGKDQSYFLFATTRKQLDFLRFPLGDMARLKPVNMPIGLTCLWLTKPRVWISVLSPMAITPASSNVCAPGHAILVSLLTWMVTFLVSTMALSVSPWDSVVDWAFRRQNRYTWCALSPRRGTSLSVRWRLC